MNSKIQVMDLTINIHLFIPDLHRFTWQSNDPLDEVLAFVFWVFENNNVSPFGLSKRNDDLIGKRQFDAVGKLIHQDMVTNIEGLQHRAGGNLEGLH